jgi:drug/metabolite transporter (DMT)-like permease
MIAGGSAPRGAPVIGLGLVLVYCGFGTTADTLTRMIAQGFEAPQLYCISGACIMMLSWVAIRTAPGDASQRTLRTPRPRTMVLRSVFFVLATVCYFTAFRTLAFAEVFAFIALVPLIAALLSGPVLGERVRWQSWCALIVGTSGMLLMHPGALGSVQLGHLAGLGGAFFGTMSMVLARHISRDDTSALRQVFYPNALMFIVMGGILPFYIKPMGWFDVQLVLAYAGVLFLARWVLVAALSRVKAYVVTPLMNFQFVLMIGVGAVLFGEMPTLNLVLGGTVIVLAGSYLFFEALWSDFQAARMAREAQILLHGEAGTAAA